MDANQVLTIIGVAFAISAAVVPIVMIWREQTKSEKQRLLDIIDSERERTTRVFDELKETTAALTTLTSTIQRLQWGLELLLNRSEAERAARSEEASK